MPRGLFDLHEYLRVYKQIGFDYHNEDGIIVAVSNDFKQGSIVTSGADKNAVDLKGENVLFDFVRKGDQKAVQELAEMGVDVKAVLKISDKGPIKTLLLRFARNIAKN